MDDPKDQKQTKDPLQDYQESIQSVFSGRLKKFPGGYLIVPSVFFVQTVDLKMPTLPEIAFFNMTPEGKAEILREANQQYSTLALSAYPQVLIREEDYEVIRKKAESLIMSPSTFPGKQGTEKRVQILRRAAIDVVEDLFVNPSDENIEKGKKVVGSFVYLLMKDPKSYLFLSQLSSHDHYTLQHSVGTAVNAIILGKKMGITDEQLLNDLGQGGLLHDIGKTFVNKDIINKAGPLDPKEWEEMRQHSEWGFNMVKDKDTLTVAAKRAILEHHEEKSGKGYPHSKPWSDVHDFAKIVAICDVFNALTTNRSYSSARSPFDAFKLMRDKMTQKLDDQLFQALVLVYGGKID